MNIVQYNMYKAEDRLELRVVATAEVERDYQVINNTEIIVSIMEECFKCSSMCEEYSYMIALDSARKPLGVFEITHGTVVTTVVSTREICIRALLIGAVNVILVHNHPSGDCRPSIDDVQFTSKLNQAFKLLDINLMDHVILTYDGWYSFKQNHKL